ncbi:MAG: hypothetical protein WD751_06510 [Anaerolineales bacterium]
MQSVHEQIKRADLTSSLGAGILGGGIALLLGQVLMPFAVPILLLGLLIHTWCMFHKHRLQDDSDLPRIKWAEWAYWACWVGLAGLAIYIVATSL